MFKSKQKTNMEQEIVEADNEEGNIEEPEEDETNHEDL